MDGSFPFWCWCNIRCHIPSSTQNLLHDLLADRKDLGPLLSLPLLGPHFDSRRRRRNESCGIDHVSGEQLGVADAELGEGGQVRDEGEAPKVF